MIAAAGDVQDALWTTLTGDAVLAPLLAGEKVYRGIAKPEAPFPYVVLASTAEFGGGFVGQRGSRGDFQIRIRTRAAPNELTSDSEGLALWKEVHRILDRQPLNLASGTLIGGRVELGPTFFEQDGRTWNGPITYRPHVVE